jgi:hypothetical protein
VFAYSRFNTCLAGKITLYFLNAYKDARLAQELLEYYVSGDSACLVDPRSKEQAALPEASHPSFLLGLIFSQYYGNGIYDYMYARFLLKVLFGPRRRVFAPYLGDKLQAYTRSLGLRRCYQEFDEGPIILIRPLIEFCRRRIYYLDRFRRDMLAGHAGRSERAGRAESAGHAEIADTAEITDPAEIDLGEFISAVIVVQRLNRENNLYYADVIRRNKRSPEGKIQILREIAAQFRHEKVFLESCARALEGAGRWDELFVRGVRRIFRRYLL